MNGTELPKRLIGFKVDKLFGEFDHQIKFSDKERITALIGPNGIGKTACLKLIDALFKKRWSYFAETDFIKVAFEFSNGDRIEVSKLQAEVDRGDAEAMGVSVNYINTSGISVIWNPKIIDQSLSKMSRFERYLPFITRSGPRSWTHDFTGQVMSIQDVIENFSDQLPPEIVADFLEETPDPIISTIKEIDCHLIETQRLLVFQSDEIRRGPATRSQLAISKKAQILKEIISRELARYAATSQSLDRSFPRRVIQTTPASSPEELASALKSLDTTRKGLTDAGILDAEQDETFPTVDVISDAISAVLKVYVSDTNEKLNVLEQLRKKIILFIDLLDDRFKPKSIEVNKRVGFNVRRSEGIDVPLEKLSSGEQHQLVLFFELLFELKPNALILIDEPELSLHVGWQKKFIPDLQKIIALNEFDVLLATHSPQLIGKWDDVVVELGDVE